MKLWLDDLRPAPDGWIWAKTVPEAIEILNSHNVSEVSLDHDLGENEQTGYDFACELERRAFEGQPLPLWAVHSANPTGRDNIVRALKSAERFS